MTFLCVVCADRGPAKGNDPSGRRAQGGAQEHSPHNAERRPTGQRSGLASVHVGLIETEARTGEVGGRAHRAAVAEGI